MILSEDQESDAIQGLTRALQYLPERMREVMTFPAPQVTVNPPRVTVEAPAVPPPIRKWTFTVQRDAYGRIERIEAEANNSEELIDHE